MKPLLLLPESGLIQELIDGLEEPAQHDDGQRPGEQELLLNSSAIQSRNRAHRQGKPGGLEAGSTK